MTFTGLNKAVLETDHAGRIYFLFLDLVGDPFYACTGTRTYTFNSQDWLGIGEIAGISDIADAADVAARPVTITMSGVDAWITEPVLSRVNYKGRSAIIYRGVMDYDETLVDDPEIIWSGRMDVGSMVYDQGTAMAQMVCEPLASRLLRANLSRYSDEDHQTRNSGDRFYEYLPQMEKKDVTWGGMRISPATRIGGDGLSPGMGTKRKTK